MVRLCVVALFTFILINFIEARGREAVKTEKRSFVETGTMTLFFLFFYAFIFFRIGTVPIRDLRILWPLTVIGLSLVVTGCIVNIVGRRNLGKNWANQVRIYQDHTLVRAGVYRLVRHPLYASLIWMFFGASMIYRNWADFLANLLLFMPFMAYRARQEEAALSREFPEYGDYQKQVGMFWPKLKVRSGRRGSM